MQIFPNGTMEYKSGGESYTDTDGFPIPYDEDGIPLSLDEDGLPIPMSDEYDGKCICTITTATEDRNAVYDAGVYKRASYTVTCNMEDVGETFSPTLVRLTHDQKGDLGVKKVLRIEYYMITMTVELWV